VDDRLHRADDDGRLAAPRGGDVVVAAMRDDVHAVAGKLGELVPEYR
jgi:hypothetical protein